LEKGKQTVLLLAYKSGLMAKEELANILIADVERQGLTCGFVGTKYLLPVLTEVGRSDLAYDLVTTTRYPSWGYSIQNGATTIWERWDSYTKENGVCTHGMNSFNHYAFGSVVEWFYEYVLGIRIKKAGFTAIEIKPYIDFTGKITNAEGSYQTQFGKISVAWQLDENILSLKIDVPKEIAFSVNVPQMHLIEQKGNMYRFVCIS